MIPKNACSTMRYSIALANGFIRDESEIGWIHQNNQSFTHSNRSAYLADFAFVIIRCPLSRIYSCYMDKIVAGSPIAKQIFDTAKYEQGASNVSFKNFLTILPRVDGNIHWIPQTFFLLFDTYDEYFCFEKFEKVEKTLKLRINLDVKDTREILKHDISRLRGEPIPKAWDVSAKQHLANRTQGIKPNIEDMFDVECVDLCKKLYRADLELYKDHFGSSALMERFGI